MALPQILGAIGAVGKATGVVPKTRSLEDDLYGLNKAFEKLSQLHIAQEFQRVTAEAENFNKALGKIGQAIKAGIQATVSPALALTTPLKGLVGVFGEIGNAVGQFVQKANPVQFQKFTLAMDDLQAVIGKALAPAMEFITRIVRLVADAFVTLIGPIQKLLESILKPLGDVFQSLFEALQPVLEIIGQLVETFASVLGPVLEAFAAVLKVIFAILEPFFRLIQTIIEPFLDIIKEVGKIIGEVVKVIVDAIKQVVDALRSLFGRRDRPSSVGAAARPATIGGVEDYGKKAQQAAFSLGVNVENYQRSSSETLTKIYDFLNRIFGKPKPGSGVAGAAGIDAADARESGRRLTLRDANPLSAPARILGSLF